MRYVECVGYQVLEDVKSSGDALALVKEIPMFHSLFGARPLSNHWGGDVSGCVGMCPTRAKNSQEMCPSSFERLENTVIYTFPFTGRCETKAGESLIVIAGTARLYAVCMHPAN